jgi:hypothetical protein
MDLRMHELDAGSQVLDRQKVDSLSQSRQADPQQDPCPQVSTATQALSKQTPDIQPVDRCAQSESSLHPGAQTPVTEQYSVEAQCASEQHCLQELSQHWNPGALQQVSPQTKAASQQTPPKHLPFRQQTPPHIASAGQHSSSPIHTVPSGQQALSQQAAGVSQQSGPQTERPSGHTHPLPDETCRPGQVAGLGVGVGRRAALADPLPRPPATVAAPKPSRLLSTWRRERPDASARER